MRFARPRLTATAITVMFLLTVAGCGQKSESEMLASARQRISAHEVPAAIIELKSTLQAYPQSGEARFLLGETLIASGDIGAAVVELDKARDLRYPDVEVMPLLAKAMLVTGEAKKLTELYAHMSLPQPKADAEFKGQMAIAFSMMGDNVRSQAAVDQALRSDPRNATARLHDVRLNSATLGLDASLKAIDEVVHEDPARRDAWQLRGDMLARAGNRTDEAIDAYRHALASDARYAPAHMALIDQLMRKGDVAGLHTAVANMKSALPQLPETRYQQAQLALLDGQLKPAREAAQQLLKYAPQNVRYLQLAGAIEFNDGSLLLAQNYLEKVVQLSPQHRAARRLLAQAYLRSGQPLKAVPVLEPLVDTKTPDAEALALTAEAHLQNGDPQRAERLFARAAALDPKNPKAVTALALTAIARGDVDSGIERLEQTTRQDSGTYADMALISVYLRRQNLDAALKVIDRLQTKNPTQPLPYYLRARVLEQRKDIAGARAGLEKTLSIDPSYFPAVRVLAELDLAAGKPDAARARYEAMLKRDPRDYRALLALAEMRRRVGAKPEEITGLLSEATRLNPTEAAPRLLLIEHLLNTGDPKAAKSRAEEALAAIPDDPKLLDALGRAQLATGSPQQAIASLGKVAAAQPDQSEAQLRLAEAYLQAGDRSAARASLRRALQITPDMLAAQRQLIVLAMQDKQSADALAIAREVQRQRSKEPVGYALESEVQAATRQWPAAVAAAQAALQRAATTENATRVHSMLLRAGRDGEADRFAAGWEREHPRDIPFQSHLGAAAIQRGLFADAEARFRKILASSPDDVLTLNNMAWVLARQNKPGGLAYAERAAKLLPESPSVLDTLASALAADKQLPKAIETQRRAVQMAPAVGQYRLALARLLIATGDKAAARTELETLAKLGDKFDSQNEVASLLKTL